MIKGQPTVQEMWRFVSHLTDTKYEAS